MFVFDKDDIIKALSESPGAGTPRCFGCDCGCRSGIFFVRGHVRADPTRPILWVLSTHSPVSTLRIVGLETEEEICSIVASIEQMGSRHSLGLREALIAEYTGWTN